MEKIVSELSSIAELLDSKGLGKFADQVDKISNVVLDIKTAQYVGVQGYWIRNTRCWSNCYRHKRASKPTCPVQEIWSECHEEYLDSFNNPGTKWDKYAGNDKGFIKSASARKQFDTKLTSSIKTKVAAGVDLPIAIAESLDDANRENFNKLIRSSNVLLDVAHKANDLSLSIRLAKTASDLTLEAQRNWYNPGRMWDAGVRGIDQAQNKAREGWGNMREQSYQRQLQDKRDRRQKSLEREQSQIERMRNKGMEIPNDPRANITTAPAGAAPGAVPSAPAGAAPADGAAPSEVAGDLSQTMNPGTNGVTNTQEQPQPVADDQGGMYSNHWQQMAEIEDLQKDIITKQEEVNKLMESLGFNNPSLRGSFTNIINALKNVKNEADQKDKAYGHGGIAGPGIAMDQNTLATQPSISSKNNGTDLQNSLNPARSAIE